MIAEFRMAPAAMAISRMMFAPPGSRITRGCGIIMLRLKMLQKHALETNREPRYKINVIAGKDRSAVS